MMGALPSPGWAGHCGSRARRLSAPGAVTHQQSYPVFEGNRSDMTTTSSLPGRAFQVGDHTVARVGFGAMQLAGPGVFGPPADRAEAVAVLRTAVELGVNHIDTADFYRPYVTNEIIREALAPYPANLCIVTKVGAVRDSSGGWVLARTPADL